MKGSRDAIDFKFNAMISSVEQNDESLKCVATVISVLLELRFTSLLKYRSLLFIENE